MTARLTSRKMHMQDAYEIIKNWQRNVPTALQQGAAPDRLQLRSLRSFLASVSALPAAGELSRCVTAHGSLNAVCPSAVK